MKKNTPISKYFIVLMGLLIMILAACTHAVIDQGSSLTNDDLVFIQAIDGTVTGGLPVNDQQHTEIPSEDDAIGGFVKSENQDGEFIYWVPEFEFDAYYMTKGYYISLLNTNKGRPESTPTSAKIDKVETRSIQDDNEILIYLNVFDDHQLINGNTHVYANSPNNDVKFFNFSGAANPSNDISVSYFNSGDVTSTIFGHYDLSELSLDEIVPNDQDTYPSLYKFTKLDENEATDGSMLLYLKTEEELDNFQIDLYSGPKVAENKFTTLDIVFSMWTGDLEAKLTGPTSMLLNWASVANENNFVGYRVYQDGEVLGELPENATSYEVSNLSIDQNYDFSVVALYDINGNRVEAVDPIHVTSKTPELRVIPTDTNVNVAGGEWIQIGGFDTFIFMPTDLPSGTKVTVTDSSSSAEVTEAENLEVAGNILTFDFDYPNGSAPTEPFLLKMHYDNSFTTDIDIYYYNASNKVWEKQNGSKNESDQSIEIHPTELSTFGVFALSDPDDSGNEDGNGDGENNDGEETEDGNNDGEGNNEGNTEDDEDNTNGKENDQTNGTTENEENNNAATDKSDPKYELPKTATPYYTYLLIGFLIIVSGTILFIWSKRKKAI